MKVFGLAGYSGSGKTTLLESLIPLVSLSLLISVAITWASWSLLPQDHSRGMSWFSFLVQDPFGLKTEFTDWGSYKDTLFRNTDVRKFNDVYRQILAGNAAQREALDAWLAERYARRELVYGLHVTNRAHMTCLVFNYSGKHLHFIDGADGGLFLAAKQFKERAAKLL